MDCIKPREDDDGAEPGFFGKLFDAANAVAARAAKRRKTMQATANKLAGHIDVDNMDDYFKKLVGSDDMMDREEFERFSKELNLTRGQATNLWFILDRDGNGLIDKAEFEEAHSSMQAARAWSRYCPECIYSNTCAFCLEPFAQGAQIIVFPCPGAHVAHATCTERWLSVASTCPTCRFALPTAPSAVMRT